MNENEYLIKIINEQLNAGSTVVFIAVTDMQGSAPRHKGTKMLVGADGKTYGTIGGSQMEALAVQEAKKLFTTGKSKTMFFDLTGNNTATPDMICGGTAEIFMDCLQPSEEILKYVSNLNKAIDNGKDFYTLTKFVHKGYDIEVTGRGIMEAECQLYPGSTIQQKDIKILKPELHNISNISVFTSGNESIIVDRIRKVKTVYCFGAGHVAVPTAHIAAMAGFHVVVLDDRKEFANKERFPEAKKLIVLDNYYQVIEDLKIDEDSYIVIITRGHQYDRQVLEQALKTSAGYIGMISSRHKRDAIYAVLKESDITKERLDFVHSPIGLNISGETPEEIAVSIVAELIQVRSQQSI